jgi:hypothetical protein
MALFKVLLMSCLMLVVSNKVMAETFCVLTADQIDSALSDASVNEEDDEIRIVQDRQIYVLETIPATGYSIDHNLTDGFRGSEKEEMRSTDFVEGDARFVNTADADFHPLTGSPAIDAGAKEDAPDDDFGGIVRPQGSSYDIGAFEYGTTPNATTDKWALWSGNTTHLRGANIYQRRVYPELDGPDFMGTGPLGPPYTQADFDRLAAQHVNYVNISHPGLYTEQPPYVLDSAVQDNLDHLIEMAQNAGLYVVISFRTGPGRSEFTFLLDGLDDWFDASYLNDRVWGDNDAQEAWAKMWRYTAERYRDRSLVVGYDLMVEPNANEVGSDYLNDRLDIWDPEEFQALYAGSTYDWNAWYPKLVAAIREVDGQTPILVGAMGYSDIAWLPYLQPTSDPYTVYTIHQYRPMRYTHQAEHSKACRYPGRCDVNDDGHPQRLNRVWLDDLLSTVAAFKAEHGVPVAVNEYGVHRWAPGAKKYLRDEMNLFEQLGVNYALWMWYPSWEPLTENDHAFNFRLGRNPTNRREVARSPVWKTLLRFWKRNAPAVVSNVN